MARACCASLDWLQLRSLVTTAVAVASLACIPLVLARRKEPASAAAWILTLIFLPGVGVVLFWFLGRDRIRRPARAKASSDELVRRRVDGLERAHRTRQLTAVASQTLTLTGLMQLASKVGRRELSEGNRVDVLLGAPAAYDAMLKAIDEARDHVHLESYIVRHDAQGSRFLEALIEAARRGVKVRLLCDAFGSRKLGRSFLRPLRQAGGYVSFFLPLAPLRAGWTLNMRNHRKLMVVDGRIAFAGGINIGEEFFGWRDVHLRVEGPAVHSLQSIFVEDWYFASRWDLTDAAFFPSLSTPGSSLLQVVDSGPDAKLESVHRLYFAAIAAARQRVLLTTPYFVPDRALLVALQTTAMRGVEVRLIVPQRSNHRVTHLAGCSYYEELLRAGVRIHEYVPSMLHTKTMIVDGELATVGSANLDVRSFRLNFELIAVLWDPAVVRQLEQVFADDLRHTHQLRLQDWRRRGAFERVQEGFGRLCSPLL